MAGRSTTIAASLICCLLAGCSAGLTGLSPDAPTSTAGPDNATAQIAASISGLACAESHVVLARAKGGGLVTERDVVLPTSYGGAEPSVSVPLPAGTHHVVHVACRNGKNVTYVGEGADSSATPWAAGKWSRSLASFTLATGETTDLGRLEIKAVGGGGVFSRRKATGVALAVVDGAGEGAGPGGSAFAPRVVRRPMTVQPAGSDKPLVLVKCALEYGAPPPPPANETRKQPVGVGSVLMADAGAPVGCSADGNGDPLRRVLGEAAEVGGE